MSVKPFEKFVVQHFLDQSSGVIKAGYKYQFKSPDPENSKNLYRAFCQPKLGVNFIDVNDSKLAYINCHGVQLITVVHNDDGAGLGYTENFISYLRDEVSAQKGAFENTALLIIHNSMLDTLINSSQDITESGGVFDPEKIKNSLKDFIDSKDTTEGREVSKILLDYQYDLIIEDESSMFGFEQLHHAISDGDIRFHEVDLLEDPAILTMKGQEDQIRKRLNANKTLHDHIEKVVQHYPDQLADHLPDYSEDFINKHFFTDGDADSWKKVSFDEFLKEQDKNSSQELSISGETSSSGQLWIRTKGETKAAKREHHIIIEVDEDRSDFDFQIDLVGAKVGKDQVRLDSKNKPLKEVKLSVSGGSKNTQITLVHGIYYKPLYFIIELKRPKTSECFKFKCLVVKKGWFNIKPIANSFVIDQRKQLVTLQTQDTDLFIGFDNCSQQRTELQVLDQDLNPNETGWIDFERLANEEERISFRVVNGPASLSFEVEGAAATEVVSLPLILDVERGNKLFTDDLMGTFNRSKQRVYVENKELKSSKLEQELLDTEAQWLESNTIGTAAGELILLDDLQRPYPALAEAYSELYSYLDKCNSLPSLSGWGPEYQRLVAAVVKEFLSAIQAIELNEYLELDQKLLMSLGFQLTDKAQHILPFHPLVLSYYSELAQRAQEDATHSFSQLHKVTLSRLNPQGLLPYIFDAYHGFSYVQALEENCFWLQCVPQQESDYSYITKLVREKVREFSEAFSCLFVESAGEARSTLIINSVNNYDNHGLFFGLVEHLIRERSKNFNIHVNIYDEDFQQTEFDRFAEMASYETIRNTYGLNKGKTRDHADTIVDLMRTRITYSKFKHGSYDQHAYAHLSFFRNNEKVEVVDVNPKERLSGISAGGLINGEASVSDKGNYITGFGTDKVELEASLTLQLAECYGRLIKPARKSTQEYRDNSAIALAVNDRFKDKLELCYDSSIWTTIIDPKVTLDFFDNRKNMLLIHYSDQYTSSAGYDAITVTRQTELYNKILEKDQGGLTSEFNAFNGEWLLKLITNNDKDRKEKMGILAAYKLVSVLLAKSDITWVPLSAAEMVRVSGNIGLKYVRVGILQKTPRL
ncbi:MAG: DNA phosphorothioation-dependent restriction protein DptH [Cellvibrionaceae bacterium]